MATGLMEVQSYPKSDLIKIVGLCLLILVAGGLYANSVGNVFTNWDDQIIYSNYSFRSLDWKNLLKIFTPVQGSTYQPVRVLSYGIDYYFWKLNPVGYHITNILFYMLTCIFVFLTLQKLSSHLRPGASRDSHGSVALLGSLLFAAHPVHVEAVTWLAARKEVLQGFFFFLAFYLYLKGRGGEGRKRIIYLSFVILSILLATLSKPSAIVFPAVIVLYEIAQGNKHWMDFVRRYWLFFTIAMVVSVVFSSILIKVMLDAGGVKPYRGGSLFNNVLVSFYIFLRNIKLLVLTTNYSATYTISLPNPIIGLKTLTVVGITFLLFGLSLWSLRKTKVIFFSFFFFLLTVLPYLNLIPISTVLADRYLFISSFSYAFMLGILFDHFYRYRQRRFSEGFFRLLSIAVFLFLLTGYSFMTLHQNRIWENSYTLWADAVEKYPESNTANALMGVVYMDLGMDEKAVEYLEKAVHVLPYDYQSRNNLGIVYGKLRQPERALRELMTAIWLKPEDDSIKINLSVFYLREKAYTKAEEILKYLISKRSQDGPLHFRLGIVYKEAGEYGKAIVEMERAIELAPHMINPYEETGNIYLNKLNDKGKAKFYYMKAIGASPSAKLKVEELRWMVQDLEK